MEVMKMINPETDEEEQLVLEAMLKKKNFMDGGDH